MIQGKTVLAVIPARGGSKGVPRKNIKPLAGKPLIAWTIEAAKRSRYVDRIVVSTEDEEIAHVAGQFGAEVPFMRPVELARDDTPGIDPVLHALEQLPSYDYVVLLQPTSPLRTADDIDQCIQTCVDLGSPACVTVTAADKPPQWMYYVTGEARLQPVMDPNVQVTRRQDAPPVYVLNGAVYVAETEWLKSARSFLTEHTAGCVMPRDRSFDLDTPLDFLVAEALIRQNRLTVQ